ncbi:hypothetical protein MIT9_P1610 [Methylomarinovum caldicuralii]|uniref:Putative beta-lactamase-inhibitor-like PepSY-like domain-containing protein n=1 Tax=Methylomarinovum caldicuralii TaxID=438856 RepID=A0AAU9CPZ9_9GAMM|nr:PepSY-like domain-containing protein [Methylomarinovum caldicuralii]BCX82028.1 hypothetical protein MIT9_P1610 [Methylomarinovum caldicuralii]
MNGKWLITAALLGGFGLNLQAEEISLEQVPEAVRQAFQKAHPNARDVEVEYEADEYDEPLYEFEFRRNSHKEEALYHTDGSFFGYERKLSPGLLPPAVKAQVRQRFPDGKIEEAEVVVNAQGEPLAYEVEVETPAGEWELYFNADGSFINQRRG